MASVDCDNFALASRLVSVAQGEFYDGKALREAKEVFCVTDEDLAILDAWLTGANGTDPFDYRMRLQDIAMKIRRAECAVKTVEETVEHSHFDLDLRDEKGRMIGVRLTRYEVDVTPQRPGEYGGYINVRPGRFLMGAFHLTKDGKLWGPSPRDKFFDTEKERDEWLALKAIEVKKRQAKKYSK
jgi:hypothetical protein